MFLLAPRQPRRGSLDEVTGLFRATKFEYYQHLSERKFHPTKLGISKAILRFFVFDVGRGEGIAEVSDYVAALALPCLAQISPGRVFMRNLCVIFCGVETFHNIQESSLKPFNGINRTVFFALWYI